ncbi:2-hydroxychromene-2-carboxylate isomerase [Microvirga sp. BT689]|uniref:2-hydroxychromene-2-carboxylate isomerase n=1 Tax=Microvirga arvi TaxID=2778731 RepID=UPI00194EEC8A|nr:2-hydroxychromene-2-carboxylate isomerase [Microvirga arvi]MBM6584109.1 2-hydroxychromene-2-carboxylate isomerase [Microvirga arvi]
MAQPLDFYFFTGSTYTYLTVNRIEARAAEAGVPVRWRPYNLRVILKETGVTPFPPETAKRRYMWRDIERRAERLGIPYTSEPPYPVEPDLRALRVALVAADEGWCPEYMRTYYRAWFIDHKPPGLDDNMAAFLKGMGRAPDAVIAQALSAETTRIMEESVEEAHRLRLFGSPHFVVAGEVFWGDDRLEEALEWALRRTEVTS